MLQRVIAEQESTCVIILFPLPGSWTTPELDRLLHEESHPVFALKKRYITDTSFDSSSKAKDLIIFTSYSSCLVKALFAARQRKRAATSW
ncbi:hypothetical protein M378DRAFT_168425 [Amanita muscaria Koide BX008]|uniref:Uncharacterized protein n=1 Tax=Amanita muscaria (strain Koide BX008) TaxID=946122 RepID=A0A0C2WTR6_AMAMK|nr:hypothetical protein M378DRAFT_168425 [Amanita muscaria Koide BX008]